MKASGCLKAFDYFYLFDRPPSFSCTSSRSHEFATRISTMHDSHLTRRNSQKWQCVHGQRQMERSHFDLQQFGDSSRDLTLHSQVCYNSQQVSDVLYPSRDHGFWVYFTLPHILQLDSTWNTTKSVYFWIIQLESIWSLHRLHPNPTEPKQRGI